jgi:hypothetical protein
MRRGAWFLACLLAACSLVVVQALDAEVAAEALAAVP